MNNEIFIIDGNKINSISDFYNEINLLFMKNENWKLGESLDALDDLLYGGYGDLENLENFTIIWKNSKNSKSSLGYETTIEYYENKIIQPKKYNTKLINEKLKNLKEGKGQTYFDIIIEIFQSHKNIKIELQ